MSYTGGTPPAVSYAYALLDGVDQTTPTGNTSTFTSAGSQYPTVTVTSIAGDTLFGCAFMEDGSAMDTTTGTESWEQNDLDVDGGGYADGASGNVTWTASSSDKCCASGVEINAAVAVGPLMGAIIIID